MTTKPPTQLPELVRDSKLEVTTFQGDLTIHSQPLGRGRTEKWRRREVLGHGGYGIVWLEHKIEEDGDAESVCRAVKVVRNRGRGPIHYVRELEALAKFSQDKFSDFFVKFLGWYENPASDYLHIAMEYCPHGDLKNYLAHNGGKLPESEVKDIASQVLAGVVMMHRDGFANRDIKPANILIKSMPPGDWWVKICDFGLSKRAEDGFAFATTTVRGTPEFMPPEILGFSTSPGRIDAFKVDMWCLGETVFQALTGQPVFGIPAAVGRYLEGSLNFPTEVLRHVNASGQVMSFIMSLMKAWPFQRMTSESAIKHPWMVDMTQGEALRASETSNMVAESTETPFQYEFPQTRVPGDQLTQASGQWTTTMTLPNQPSLQQGGFRSGNTHNFPSIAEPHSIQPPYYIPMNAEADSQHSLYSDYLAKYPNYPYNTNPPGPYSRPWGPTPFIPPDPIMSYPSYSPPGMPYQAPAGVPVAPPSSSVITSDPAIIFPKTPLPRASSLLPLSSSGLTSSATPAYHSPSMHNPDDGPAIPFSRESPLIRRKTKSIDASKCSILSHLKIINPLPGENWDDNDGLRPSYDSPLSWKSPSKSENMCVNPRQEGAKSESEKLLAAFKDFARNHRQARFYNTQEPMAIEGKEIPEEEKVVEDIQESPITVATADVSPEWKVVTRRKRGRK